MGKNDNYFVVGIAQGQERLDNGFTIGHHSTDGKWILGGKSGSDECTWIVLGTFPTWMTDLVPSLLTSAKISKEDAHKIATTEASAKGASDGYFWNGAND